MSFNKPVGCEFSFRGFAKRGTDNPDGWDIVFQSMMIKSLRRLVDILNKKIK